MKRLSDHALERLRRAADQPDLSTTRYRLVREIARGGMGVVYLARDMELDRAIALKVLQLDDDAGGWALRMRRETRILARLEHPNIVPIYDAGVLSDGRVYYAMKYVEGQRLDEHRAASSLTERLRVFSKICEGVAFAHSRGVAHRDLKPDNVMVGRFGEVLIMDWGVAKILADEQSDPPLEQAQVEDRLTAHGTIVGTAAYMAPEQARGEPVDARADIYSLGAILRFLCQPVEKPPRALLSIVDKAMASQLGAKPVLRGR